MIIVFTSSCVTQEAKTFNLQGYHFFEVCSDMFIFLTTKNFLRSTLHFFRPCLRPCLKNVYLLIHDLFHDFEVMLDDTKANLETRTHSLIYDYY